MLQQTDAQKLDTRMQNLRLRNMELAEKVKHINDFDIKSNFSKKIIEFSVDPLKLIGVMLLTDGNVYRSKNRYIVSYASKDRHMTDVFIELVKMWMPDKIISIYRSKYGVDISYFSLPEKNELFELSPNYKKAPRNEPMEEYLSSPQPTLKFIKDSDINTKILAIRLALSAEGSISFRYDKIKAGIRVDPILALACANPSLCNDWAEIFSSLGVEMVVNRNKKKWSGINGIRTIKKSGIRKFVELGGFIEGLLTSDKAKYFFGIEKNKVLETFALRQEFKDLEDLISTVKPGWLSLDRSKRVHST